MNYSSFLKIFNNALLIKCLVILFVSCCSFPIFIDKTKCYSGKTSWSNNNKKYGKFFVENKKPLPFTGPGLKFVVGGSFIMGNIYEDVFYDWDNTPRRVTVSSFYIDETEISNADYREYIFWLDKIFGADYPQVVFGAVPDTLVWLNPFTYNEPFAKAYFRHPSFTDYPVVGVTWYQAIDYSNWRTDRVNENILMKGGYIKFNPEQKNENNFNTEAYVSGLYEVQLGKKAPVNLSDGKSKRKVDLLDGILLPDYRLPTEAEWEYAANGIKVEKKENSGLSNTNKKIYTWYGEYVRRPDKKGLGKFYDNFKKGKGDYMGVAGDLNDGYSETAPVKSNDFLPNDFGLYHMAGNVSEWVFDVYRPLSTQDISDNSPFRGNVFKVIDRNIDGSVERDSIGKVRKRMLKDEDFLNKSNISRADYRNYRDGDLGSSVDWNSGAGESNSVGSDEKFKGVYNYGKTTLINNESRVIKGGSWKDPAYYVQISNKRFLQATKSSDWLGFRCAMSRIGPPVGEGKKVSVGSPGFGILGFIEEMFIK